MVGNLLEVLLGSTVYDEMYSNKYIRAIYEHCPNTKILTLGINADDYDDFEILLKRCQQLQRIVIDGSPKTAHKNFDSLLLEKLLRSVPKSLRKIRFFDDWKISLNDLESFPNNWRGRESIFWYIKHLVTRHKVFFLKKKIFFEYWCDVSLGIINQEKRDVVLFFAKIGVLVKNFQKRS